LGISQVNFISNLNSTLINFTVTCSGSSTTKLCVINFTNIKAGAYQYQWLANDTSGFSNSTPITNYSVLKAPTSIRLFLNGTESNKTYSINDLANFTAIINITGKTVNMTSNVTGFNNASNLTRIEINLSLNILGTFNLTARFDGDENYTSSRQTRFFTVNTSAPTVTLNSPINNFNSSSSSITFNCSATDNLGLVNITLYGNWSSVWKANETKNLNGTSNSTTFSKTITPDDTYDWNCEAFDNESNSAFASGNYTFTVDTVPPTVQLESPANNTLEQSNNTIVFSYNASDTISNVANCSLYIDEVLNHTNTTVEESTTQNFTATLTNAYYNWSVGCDDFSGNTENSTTFFLNVSVSVAASVTLNSPIDNFNSSSSSIIFNCSATDDLGLVNITLYGNWSSVWKANETKNLTGLSNSTTFSKTITPDDAYAWNCEAFDNESNSAFAESNFTITIDGAAPTLSISPANNTNITSSGAITVDVADKPTGVRTTQFTTGCGASGTFTDNVVFYPFNDTSGACTGSGVRTLTINATDHANNSNVSAFLFGVDDTAPTINAISPGEGLSLENNILLNVTSADDRVKISFVGYYLDGNTLINISFNAAGLGSTASTLVSNLSVNFTGGNHTIKFTANDTVGNLVNSTSINFIVVAPIPLSDWTSGLNSTLGTEIAAEPIFRVKNASGAYNIQTGNQLSNGTFELIITANSTGTNINITLSDFDGSTANWAKINSTYLRTNNTEAYTGIQSNWTNTILHMVYANNSLTDFAKNTNGYYGTITFPINNSLVQEFWWLEDETDLLSRTNITQCETIFTATDTTPCWNYTTSGRTIVFVPHYSVIVAVNDSGAPVITVNKPDPTQTVSTFLPNITVSSDAVSCKYLKNGSKTNVTMTITGTECIGTAESYKNLEVAEGYNITFYAEDSSGNIATGIMKFNVSDNTAPIIDVINSSPEIVTGSITLSANESVNTTVAYGKSNTSQTSEATETDFSTSQTVSLSGLSAATKYYYNVTVCDFNGNCVKNGTFNFTTDSAGASPASDSSGGSGGGGGGGGGSLLAGGLQDTVNHFWKSLEKGSTGTVKIRNREFSVSEIDFKVGKDSENVELSVIRLESKPEGVSDLAGDLAVFQYFEVDTKNLEDIEEASMRFEVKKSWFDSENLDKNSVALYRHTGQWDKLKTEFLSEDSFSAFYLADVPGFSYFAVGAKSSQFSSKAESSCGDGICDPEETSTCPEDCKPYLTCASGQLRCENSQSQLCVDDKWEVQELCGHGCDSVTNLCSVTGFAQPGKSILYSIPALFAVVLIFAIIYAKYHKLIKIRKNAFKKKKIQKKVLKVSKVEDLEIDVLKNYIRASLKTGSTKDIIHQELKERNWPEKEVIQAFKEIKSDKPEQ